MIELPRGRERDYLLAFGATAIYAATCEGRPSAVITARDPHRSVAAIEYRFRQHFEVHWISWTTRNEAEIIIDRVRSTLPAIGNSLLDVSIEQAERAICSAARGINLTDHETVMARARRNVERLDQRIAQAQQRGKLRFFNRAYRRYRELRISRGEPVISYSQARIRLRRALALAADEWASEFINPAIVQRVLPGL